MRPGGFFGRVVQWLANEIIVKGLSNSPAFQRFAVRSSQQAKELSKSAAEAAKNLSESDSVQQLRQVCWDSAPLSHFLLVLLFLYMLTLITLVSSFVISRRLSMCCLELRGTWLSRLALEECRNQRISVEERMTLQALYERKLRILCDVLRKTLGGGRNDSVLCHSLAQV